MGTEAFDAWSIGHFLMGSLSQSLLQKAGITTPINLILTNFIHLMIELFEKDVKHGKLVESYENHITDIILFLAGWCLSYFINVSQYLPQLGVEILWGILILLMIKEILVEIYIDKKEELNDICNMIIIFLSLIILAKHFLIH